MNFRFSPNRLASLIWSGANRAARFARDHGYIEARKLPVRTIGIGNVQAGGAGKTPLTIRLAREAVESGQQVGVLLRGYHGAWERTGGILSPFEPAPSPGLCGDEAALIRDQVPGVWVGVGADRVAQFEVLEAAAVLQTGRGFDLILLDDAFQHWKIQCDQYIIAVTDAKFGEQIFRDPYSAIHGDDILVLTKGDEFPEELRDHPRRVRARYLMKPGNPGLRYHFVAAIADPERARNALSAAGYSIRDMTVFPDHYAFSLPEIERILREALSIGATVLLSGKDWVKWRALGIEVESVEVVEPSIEILEGEAIWRSLLEA